MKGKKKLAILLCFFMTVSLIAGFPIMAEAAASGNWADDKAGSFAGGAGTASDPYQIATAEQLAYLASIAASDNAATTGKYYAITADIDLSDHYWTPIAYFKGNLDGGNHAITGLSISTASNYQGLFGIIWEASLSNVILKNCSISGSSYIGGLAGYAQRFTVSNCLVSGSLSGVSCVGGLVGDIGNEGPNTYTGSGATATVSCTGDNIGGLFGYFEGSNTTVTKCFAAGSVSGGSCVGGIVGHTPDNAGILNLTDCYASGNVYSSSGYGAGGIVGRTRAFYLYLTNCYQSGAVTAGMSGSVGAVIGDNATPKYQHIKYTNTYYYSANPEGGTLSPYVTSDSTVYSISADTSPGALDMKDTAAGGDGTNNFAASLNAGTSPAIWYADTGNINGGHPVLAWQMKPIVITTATCSAVTTTSAACSGNVTSDGGNAVTARGFVCGTDANPAVGGTGVTNVTAGSGTGALSATLTGLAENTTYHVRAYATNSIGTSYGSDLAFTTLADAPAVSAATLSAITTTGALASGNVTSDGGSAVNARGFVYGAGTDPAIGGSGVTNAAAGSGLGAFSATFSGLTRNTVYHVRAYATNGIGTSYSADVTFSTLADVPAVSAATLSGITTTSAAVSGNVTSDGGSAVTAKGFVYGAGADPAIGGSGVTNVTAGSGTGAISATLTGLTVNTAYHMRAYATNGAGTTYSSDVTFSTLADVPTVSAATLSGITTTGALASGNVTSDGGSAVTARGFVYGAGADPAIGGSGVTNTAAGSGTGALSATLTGLTANTAYHMRAYATNSIGTSYSADVTFATLAEAVIPTVTTTTTLSSITTTSAVASGSVTSDGGSAVTVKGFVCGANTNPAIGGSGVTATAAGSGTGALSATLTGLTADTTYHVRAYATNGVGTSYGADITFKTSAVNNGGGNDNGGGSSSKPAPPPAHNAEVKTGTGQAEPLPITVDTASNTGTASLGAAKAKELFNSNTGAIIAMPPIPGVNAYTLELPAASLSDAQGNDVLTMASETGDITIPANMLSDLSGTDGKKVGITIEPGGTAGLTDEEKAAIGDRPLIQLTFTLDGKKTEWNNPNAPVTVSIPYTPTAEELTHPESIIIWYIDGSGKSVCVPNGRYHSDTGTVTFTTTHFSYYAVGYNQLTFKDVTANAWYNKAVSFIAAREITTGTGSGNYSPDAKLTRGEFIVLLMRAYGITPGTDPQDNFADAGNTYYTKYLAEAKRMGITGGVGNNLYAPEKQITRQEMFTLLYNALKIVDGLPEGQAEKPLSSFSDAGKIASWSKNAMTLFVNTGTISGSNGKLSPTSTTTRAEMAQVLYNLLSK